MRNYNLNKDDRQDNDNKVAATHNFPPSLPNCRFNVTHLGVFDIERSPCCSSGENVMGFCLCISSRKRPKQIKFCHRFSTLCYYCGNRDEKNSVNRNVPIRVRTGGGCKVEPPRTYDYSSFGLMDTPSVCPLLPQHYIQYCQNISTFTLHIKCCDADSPRKVNSSA
jgi:hypothetical protein